MSTDAPAGSAVARLRLLLAATPAGATDWGRDLALTLDALDVARDAADVASRTGLPLDPEIVHAALAPALHPHGPWPARDDDYGRAIGAGE